MSTDDARIRSRVRQGDSDAFAALFDEHARLVYNHALRLTGDRSTAEEVLSETFLAAWRRRSSVEPDGGSLRPWLLGIATRQAMGATRSAGRRRRFLADQPAPRAGEDISDLVAGRVDDGRRLASARHAIEGLTRDQREVLALCVWAGLDYQQAAAALAVPVGTVRSRLSRTRARLRELTARQVAADRHDDAAARAARRDPGPRPRAGTPRPDRRPVQEEPT